MGTGQCTNRSNEYDLFDAYRYIDFQGHLVISHIALEALVVLFVAV